MEAGPMAGPDRNQPDPRHTDDPPETKPGIEYEPHLGPTTRSEVDRSLDRAAPTTAGAEIENSIADEPAAAWAPLDRARTPGFREHLAAMRAGTGRGSMVLAALLAAFVAGPLAVLGALMEGLVEPGAGQIAMVVFGPVVEEMMKIAAVLWLVERKPWLLSGPIAILLVGVVAGLSFASIENVVYLRVYVPDPGIDLVRWRWTICVAVHVTCSMIAALGVARIWRTVMATGERAEVARGMPLIATAILIHGGYNALAVSLSMFGTAPE